MDDHNLRDGASSPGTSDRWPDQAQIFQIDRSRMVFLLRDLRRGLDEGAKEMAMVAVEGVFTKSRSRSLTRWARKLRLVSKDLSRLMRQIEGAPLPKTPNRPEPNRKQRNQRNGRS